MSVCLKGILEIEMGFRIFFCDPGCPEMPGTGLDSTCKVFCLGGLGTLGSWTGRISWFWAKGLLAHCYLAGVLAT